jgi:ParB family chromosome partitioning protein
MRHDAHYVDELAQHRPTPVGRLIAVDKLDPNPEQPRVEIGSLEELTASIKEKGVLEPLLVKPSALGGRWMIIAGERRWRAAREAGLREVPCIEMDVDDRAVAEIALIENMQRKDLTPWEEADGLKALCERFNYTHEEVARKVGKSRSTVTEALSIATIPEAVRERCRRADIATKSLLLQIVRQPDEDLMAQMAEDIISRGMTRDDARASRRSHTAASREKASSRPYVFRYSSPKKEFRLELRFRRSQASTEDVSRALKQIIDDLPAYGQSDASDKD